MAKTSYYRKTLAPLRAALLADISETFNRINQSEWLFEEPWHLGAALDDSWPYVAGGMRREAGQLLVLDTRNGGSYEVEKLHLDDLLWVLDALEVVHAAANP